MTIIKPVQPRKDDRLEHLKEMVKDSNSCLKFSMNIPRSLHREFRMKCVAEGKDMKDVLMEAIRKYMLT